MSSLHRHTKFWTPQISSVRMSLFNLKSTQLSYAFPKRTAGSVQTQTSLCYLLIVYTRARVALGQFCSDYVFAHIYLFPF